MNYYKPRELSYIILTKYYYDYVVYDRLPEKYYISEIKNNKITKSISYITPKITKLPTKIYYDFQERMKFHRQK